MTPQESRAEFIESQFNDEEITLLKENGMYDDYVTGFISINTIYTQFKEQGL